MKYTLRRMLQRLKLVQGELPIEQRRRMVVDGGNYPRPRKPFASANAIARHFAKEKSI